MKLLNSEHKAQDSRSSVSRAKRYSLSLKGSTMLMRDETHGGMDGRSETLFRSLPPWHIQKESRTRMTPDSVLA